MILGIDFGTKNLIAAWVGPDGSPLLISDKHDAEIFLTPACVCLEADRAHLGRAAEIFSEENPSLPVARGIKSTLASATPVLKDGRQEGWHAETAAALLLRKVTDDAALAMGRRPERATLAVPHGFGPAQRQALRRAVGSSRVDLQACKLEYSIVSPK